MEKLAKQVLICGLLTALFWLSRPVMSEEVDDEREFNYDVKDERGPHHWGNIKSEWSACSKGLMQSPIDLLNEKVQIVSHLGKIQMNYHPSNATLKNRGHDIKMDWLEDTSNIQINETQYALKHFHWHSPSEHTIDGKQMDLELHMMHETPSGEIAVIGILYKDGDPDRFLSSLRADFEEISDGSGEQTEVGAMDPGLVKIDTSTAQYYRYIGSLTVPPCTENITWTILSEVRSVSSEQIELLRVAVHDESDNNARPVQPLNNRLVQLYKP